MAQSRRAPTVNVRGAYHLYLKFIETLKEKG